MREHAAKPKPEATEEDTAVAKTFDPWQIAKCDLSAMGGNA
jgi:hypothetical protein